MPIAERRTTHLERLPEQRLRLVELALFLQQQPLIVDGGDAPRAGGRGSQATAVCAGTPCIRVTARTRRPICVHMVSSQEGRFELWDRQDRRLSHARLSQDAIAR